MKRFTQKFFLLAIGMILSVGAYAQYEGKHRYPQFDFTYNGVEYFMPEWDIRTWNSSNPQSYLRLVRTGTKTPAGENLGTNGGTYYAKIVTGFGLQKDPLYFFSRFSTTENSIIVSYKNAAGESKTKKIEDLRYSDFVSDDYADGQWFSGTNYAETPIFWQCEKSGYGLKVVANTVDYIVPETFFSGTEKQGHYVITEVGDYAYKNQTNAWTSTINAVNAFWFMPKTITIPKGITKIGQGAFMNGRLVQKVTFAADSEIEEIPGEGFMNYIDMTEITFPASVEKIYGAALGGCEKLEKITFGRTTPPTFKPYNGKNWIESTGSHAGLTPSKCTIVVPLGSFNNYRYSADFDGVYSNFSLASVLPINNNAGAITYCSEVPFTMKQRKSGAWVDDEELKAYYVTKNDIHESSIHLTEITDAYIPAGQGVILTGGANTGYDIFYHPFTGLTKANIEADNCLVGVLEDTPMESTAEDLLYILWNGKFYLATGSGTLAANRAYLDASKAITVPVGGAKTVLTISDSDVDGIVSYQAEEHDNGAFYTLQGIQVNQPQKGIVIKNGKKFVIK